ncbi:MAG: cytochrome P450 [Gammaproteobacteria bacterium]|nr:cytochrome P450 [Gammaproteobacteria bacterium]
MTIAVPHSLPVSVPRARNDENLFRRMLKARKNLLAIWSDKDYGVKSLEFSLLRQQYILCNSPDMVRRVFLEEHDNYDRKSPQMRHALEPLLGDGLFASDGELWQQRREYCAPAFEKNLMPDFAGIMTESAAALVEQWQALPAGAPVDMLNEMARLTARIIGRTVFGDNTSDAEAARIVQGFTDYQRQVDQLGLADTLGVPLLRLLRNPTREAQARLSAQQVHGVINDIIARYQQDDKRQRFSLISLLLEGKMHKPGVADVCPLGAEAARNEAIVMFMAGHETTANALAWAWYLLDHSPAAMAKLQAELDQVLGGRHPTLEDVDNLPYTRAVFEETMRLYPPVPLLSRQARAADSMRGRNIKPDAIMLVLPWLLHRHEKYWDQPNAFLPERFMPGQPRPNKFLYLPFSVGRRVCLGKRFGLTEGIICLATLAQQFTPRLVPGHKVAIECRLTLRPEGGLPMLLERR